MTQVANRQVSAALITRVDRYLADAARLGSYAVLRALKAHLLQASEIEWSDIAWQFVQRGQPLFAVAVLELSLTAYPSSMELRYWLGHAHWQVGDAGRAETELRRVLAAGLHVDAGKLLASVLRGVGRLNAAAECMAGIARAQETDMVGLLACIQFVRECQRQELAGQLCTQALGRGLGDPRLHALAGQIAQELGQFDYARKCYDAALALGIDLNSWFVLGSMASLQRYADPQHPDFALFAEYLQVRGLSPRARSSILFAHGKAHDDIGDYAAAAKSWRQANGLMHELVNWSRPAWKGFVQARLAAAAPPLRGRRTDCVPIFVVGLPRTGTTLMAELLGRHPDVCNRGELPTLEYLAQQLSAGSAAEQSAHIREAAEIYLTHLRRDDAPVGHYIDKNPLNFRYLDYVAAMFPQARVIHCRRQPRDTALSIWSQPFARDEYAFARDFADIAALAEGCDELMAHWRGSLPLPILTVDYEQLVADTSTTMDKLLPQLGLEVEDPVETAVTHPVTPITSASLWQARQPVHQQSVSRWRHYARLLPELTQLFPEQ